MKAQANAQIENLCFVKQEGDSRQGRKQSQEKENRIWNKQEVYLIAAFLYHNHQKFSSETTKKKWKVFKFMSLFVSTRNINQCRTYLRKLLKTFKTVPNINTFFQSSLVEYDSAMKQLKDRNDRLYRQFNVSEDGDTERVGQNQGDYEQEISALIVKKQEGSSVSESSLNVNLQRQKYTQIQSYFLTQRMMLSHLFFQEWIASLQELYRHYCVC